jgi:hypothetical protein
VNGGRQRAVPVAAVERESSGEGEAPAAGAGFYRGRRGRG